MSRRSHRHEDDEDLAGRDIGRLLALSDGVFAIAITILVLNLDVPRGLSAAELGAHLHVLLPRLGSAALSFAVIGRFWISHREIFSHVRRIDRVLLWLNLAFLAAVVFMPFATQLIAEYYGRSVPVMIYAGTIGAGALAELAIWVYAAWGGLFADAHPGRRAVIGNLADMISAAVAFLVSVPVALVLPSLAPLCWLGSAVPARLLTARLRPDRPS